MGDLQHGGEERGTMFPMEDQQTPNAGRCAGEEAQAGPRGEDGGLSGTKNTMVRLLLKLLREHPDVLTCEAGIATEDET